MNVQINVGQETTAHEYRSLATFFSVLAGANLQAEVQPSLATSPLRAPIEPAIVVDIQPNSPAPDVPEAGSEKTRRSRRTKAEIEAEAQKSNEAELAKLDLAKAAEVIDKATGEIKAALSEGPLTAQAAEEFEAVGGKAYTEAEVQNLASTIARVKGPQIVKDKIAELGAARISALTADQLNSLGAFLETQK